MTWQLQEAKQRFSEVVRCALAEGPQTVTRRGEAVVVVLSAAALGLICLALLWWVVRSYRRQSEEMRRAALVDPVTGLGNEGAFAETLRGEVSRAVRHDLPLSLALLRIDNHADAALADLARVGLTDLLTGGREEDRAFRIDADTFALILPYTTAEAARVAVDRLLKGAAQRLFGAAVSAGVAGLSHADPDVLLQQAQLALSAANDDDPGRIVVFTARFRKVRGSA